ncbi:MAG: hypothetical protein CMI53_02715 [Parcubacteria group bacterium]|nr:hypothetical protein [Parcubacteria group bacterium]|tara:strand:+ start:840 stop:1214 length:375 start_codon:yes stop_codon:yes gene_type:complete
MNKNKYKIFKRLIFLFLIFSFFALTSTVLAQVGTPTGPGLQNPLGQNDPRVIIGNIIKAALGVVGSLTLAFFIIGGFFWITSAGNDEKVKRGKDIIVWSSFGLALIFFSYALVTFLLRALSGAP